MRILAIISGEYGRRHVDNLRCNGPSDWEVYVWDAPAVLPPVIDYPEDYLPEHLPAVDLVLSLAE
ncbi:MAG: thymidylate synthase, partial [Chloroflexi bacterium]|nr:thymidylate synthase [Chloroflexota bacterium]